MARGSDNDPVRALDAETIKKLQNVDQDLRLALPDFMVPSYYLPIHKFPLTTSGKADTRKLQEWILHLAKQQQLAPYSLATRAEFQRPTTAMQLRLQKLWADILGLEADSIGRDDSFLRLGGDSIAAIRLVSAAREEGIHITVASIFRDPRLSQVAASAILQDVEGQESSVAPWSLVPEAQQETMAATIRNQCRLGASDEIQDAYPATALQQGLMSLAVKQPGSYIARMTFQLPSDIDEHRFREAWQETLRLCPILRTRIVAQANQAIQAVISQPAEWDAGELTNVTMEHGTRLCRYALVDGGEGKLFMLALHHAIFDGWSLPLIMRTLLGAYQHETAPALVSYARFVRYALDIDSVRAAAYWKAQLENAARPSFPRRPDATAGPRRASSQSLARHLPFDTTDELPVTKATVLRAAWAILMAKYNDDASDITFGATVAGRQAAVTGIEEIAGPVIATVPIRIKLDARQPVAEFLHGVQTQGAEMMPFEQFGMQNISRLGPDAKNACDFSSLLVIQPFKILKDTTNPLLQFYTVDKDDDDAASSALTGYFTYPLVWQCCVTDTETALYVTFDSSVLSREQIETMIEQFCHIVQQLIAPDAYSLQEVTVADICVSGTHDIALARDWNSKVCTEIISSTFHDLVQEQARIRPNAPAIFAWDGELSYRQLDVYSNRLAKMLVKRHSICLGDLVLVCFEKSVFFYIVVLAINKAGGAWVPLDPSHPQTRHQKVTMQSEARIALVSPKQADKCRGLVAEVITVPTELDPMSLDEDDGPPAVQVGPQDAAYVLFTSGTTGTPKGIVMEHGSLCTSQVASSRQLGLEAEQVRILQFAAYVFDLCIGEIIGPLISGGCLCVPSEYQRMNDIVGFINKARVNWAYLTPSFARFLVPDSVPSLQLLLLAGEPVGKDLLSTWLGHGVRLVNGWGPSETCCFSSLLEWSSPEQSPLNIGRPVGGHCWIVDPSDHHQLAPIGCIGEVVIQGPTIAREYLAFEEGTRASFVTDLPAWAPRVDEHYARFYKSGDLAYYNADSTMEFVARKDTQVKVRGFRVELGEVEHHVRLGLPEARQVVVDVLAASESDATAKLVAYLCFSSATSSPDDEGENNKNMMMALDEALSKKLLELKAYLEVRLPQYMVPAVFIPIRHVPFITSHKINRNLLRTVTRELCAQELAPYMLSNTEKEAPATEHEVAMQKLWAEVLHVPVELIGRHDSFLQLGGDSLSAMRLVSKAYEAGIQLSVGSIFKDARLAQVAAAACFDDSRRHVVPEPWELIEDSKRDRMEQVVRQQCGLSDSDIISDVYPATALQEGLIALASKQPGSYMAGFTFELTTGTSVQRFKDAWEKTLARCPALRTRIVLCSDETIQAVLERPASWGKEGETMMIMGYGTPLCAYSLTKKGDESLFSLTMHHAIFDGWSLGVIMRILSQEYDGQTASLSPLTPYVSFVKYTLALDEEKAAEYWRGQLAQSLRPEFPPRDTRPAASTSAQAHDSHVVRHHFAFDMKSQRLVTKATVLRAAWAVVMARYNNADNITFGAAVAGRQASVAGIQDIVGPVLSTVPVCVGVSAGQTVKDFLLAVQAQAVGMIAFEHMGLQNIGRLGPEARDACDFSSMFSVLYSSIVSDVQTSILKASPSSNASTDFGTYFTYPLVAQCFLSEQEAILELVYNSSSLSRAQVEAIAAQYSHVVEQLLSMQSADDETVLADVTLCGEWDMSRIKQWHDALPPIRPVEACIHHLISATAAETPEKQALYASKESFTYAEFDDLTSKLAWHLGRLGVGRGSLVPFSFEKSPWAIIAMLGILKAGGAFVPLNPNDPIARQKTLLADLGAELLLASSLTAERYGETGISVVVVTSSLLSSLSSQASSRHDERSIVGPHDIAYVLFTSGSTGTPKGVVVEHWSLSSIVSRRPDLVTFGADSRVLQFSKFVFDVSLEEIFATLLFGGTLCIPSEEQRIDDLANFINEANVSCAMLTPSVARLMTPAQVPQLKTLLVAGEPPSMDLVETWSRSVELCNDYGPAEACVYVASHLMRPTAQSASTIGRGCNSRLWIVDAENHDRLAPVGCIGELMIESPGVARHYLNDATKTEQAFFQGTSWLPRDGQRHRIYKTGDLVRYNLDGTTEGDGTIEYIGRKDGQTKIRGQRLEIGEIEYHINHQLGPQSTSSVQLVQVEGNAALFAFVSTQGKTGTDETEAIAPLDKSTLHLLRNLHQGLQSILPSYMLPSYYLPIAYLPLSASGKTNGRALRQWVKHLSAEQLADYSLMQQVEFESPVTDMEIALQRLWGSVLKYPAEKIGLNDSFLELGGDSIRAIRLIAAAREEGIMLTVSAIFRDARLRMVAAAATTGQRDTVDEGNAEPLSLLPPHDLVDITNTVRQQCSLSANDVIQDIYPATPLQEGLMALATKKPGSYTARFVYQLAPHVDVDRFTIAWQHVVRLCSTLRTRIVMCGERTVQAVVQEPAHASNLDKVEYGSPLCHCSIESRGDETLFKLVMHHAIFDAWSLGLILQLLIKAYHDPQSVLPPPPYANFVRYTLSLDLPQASEYWRKKLEGALRPVFPRRSGPLVQASGGDAPSCSSKVLLHRVPFEIDGQLPVTKATVLQAAWAIVLAQYNDDAEDIVFGAVVAGRQAPVAGIETMIGPVLSTVPIRVSLPRRQPVQDVLLSIHAQANEMVPFEHLGIQNISKLSKDAQDACDFSSLFTIQYGAADSQSETPFLIPVFDADRSTDFNTYFTYPLVGQCCLLDREAQLQLVYDSSVLSEPQVARLAAQYERTVQQLLSIQHEGPGQCLTLDKVNICTDWDKQAIEQWNSSDPELMAVNECVHELIAKRAAQMGDEEAIFSSDGCCTYKELDKMTTLVGNYLQSQGVGIESLVPICFEKSMWTIVAMIAVMKAGGGFVPLNPDHPIQRRQQLVTALKAPLMLVSPSTFDICQEMDVPLVTISADFVASLPESVHSHDAVPSNIAYVLFTSGSTGAPKGVVIEHRAIASSIFGHGVAMGIESGTRVLQFSNYIFDGSITECLATLVLGGTVCVPSDGERLDGLQNFLVNARVDWAMLTPSFVRTLNREQALKTLKTLVLGGEAVPQDVVDAWAGRVNLINAYGPAEASVCIATHTVQNSTQQQSPRTIGRGRNSRLWIVDAQNHDRLAAVYCIGELVVQGPSLARGYLNDEKRTQQAFIQATSWLPFGEHQRLYKTGDLARYNSDGTIEYMGRKDSQVKLRGQRLEPGEVEFHIKQILGSQFGCSVQIARDALFAFICTAGPVQQTGKATSPGSEGNCILGVDKEVRQLFNKLQESLRLALPAFMVPSYYLSVSQLPLTASGKIDGNALQAWALGLSTEDLVQSSPSVQVEFEPPETEMEGELQKLWSQVLGVSPDKIGRSNSFLQLGGDSITAIRLVAAAREKHISLSVSSIFQDARLKQVAALAEFQDLSKNDEATLEPFALVLLDKCEELCQAVREQCALAADETVQDVFPTIPLQEGLMALAVKQPGSYMARFVFELADQVDVGRFKAAWEATLTRCAALRTRIIIHNGQTLQAIIQQAPDWKDANSAQLRMAYGTPLCRYYLASRGSKKQFVLTMHHAIFDGWSFGIIMRTLLQAYQGIIFSTPLTPYAGFVKYVVELDVERAAEFWNEQLDGALQPVFPRRAAASSRLVDAATASRTLVHQVPFEAPPAMSVTKATVLRAAWAITLARYNDGTDDITFGAAVAGRQAPVSGIEGMVGPVISTLPVRVKLNSQQRVGEFLGDLQSQATDMMPFEHMGLQNIAKLGSSAREACDFSSLLVIQPQAITGDVESGFLKLRRTDADDDQYFSYPLVWQCYLAGDQVHLHVTYDSSVLGEKQASLMANQFCHVVEQLLAPDVHLETSSVVVGDVTLCGPRDLAIVTEWNKKRQAEIVSSTLHELVAKQARMRPSCPAIYAWDGQLSYQELDTISTRWATYLSYKYHVKSEELVPLCFEKSLWFYVAMLAVNKAGGAWLPLDPSHPTHRHQVVVKQAKARIILTSPTAVEKARGLARHVEVLSPEADKAVTETLRDNGIALSVKAVQPSNIAYVLFTSGTTGTPKGMVMEHGALCSSMTASSKRLGIDPDNVRQLQFAAYVFDLAIGEIIPALISGACICVPSEHQRLNDLSSFVAESRANWAYLTPSFSRILSPTDVPGLEVLMFAGEAVGTDHLAKWFGRLRLINAWGPSEACCFASFREYETVDDSPLNIGFPVGARSWIVEPDDYHRLVPIGCVGEIMLQGPTLAREYLAFEAGTKASFITDLPEWAPDREQVPYSRFYKSGDLGYYNADGTMEFVARKDTQVKIRGFRIELGEVESQVRNAVGGIQQVTVDVLKSQGVDRLVAYLCYSSAMRTPESGNSDFSDLLLPMDETMTQEAASLKSFLQVRLPLYMVPTVYIPVRYMPFITSQKTDRRILRQTASSISNAELEQYMLANATKEPPATAMETLLQSLWADVLSIPTERIGRNDSFLHLGGDSLGAIRLITKARQHGVQLSVANIFKDARLSQVALAAQTSIQDDDMSVAPWSLVPAGQKEALVGAAEEQCRVHEQGLTIQDIYPTTPLQEGLMALAVKQAGSYTAKLSLELAGADVGRFKAAWEYTLGVCAALRTRIFRHGPDTMQAVLTGPAQWQSSAIEACNMVYGSALCQYALFSRGDDTVFSLAMHHAIFDGWSLSIIMKTLTQAYEASGNFAALEPLPPYSLFIRHVRSLDQVRAAEYWRGQLQGALSPVFPPRPTSTCPPLSSKTVTQRIALKSASQLAVTKATILRAAWAIVLAKHNANAQDITFGAAVAGRQAPVYGIESIVGPVISTVPIRVKLDEGQSAQDFLKAMQSQAVEMMPYEHMGIQNIAQLGADARQACDFTSLFAVQHRTILSGAQASFLTQSGKDGDKQQTSSYATYFTYPLVGQCYLFDDEAALELIYDGSALSDGQAEAFAAQYEHIVQQLLSVQVSGHDDLCVGQLRLCGSWDVEKIEQWHAQEPELTLVESRIQDLIGQTASSCPDKEAILSWDGRCTYAQLEHMTCLLAQYLGAKGVTKGSRVPICFEKSMWTIVAMMGILKAGGAFVPLSPDHPASRRRELVRDLGAKVVVVSEATQKACSDLGVRVVVLSAGLMGELSNSDDHEQVEAMNGDDEVTPGGGAAYVLFTSGSTGKPKGVIVDHYAIASSIKGHGTAMGLGPESRVLQFSNYIFDGSITECLATLVFGGCVCVPGDEERLGGSLSDFIQASRVNWAMLTPSFVRTLDQGHVPTLKTLVLGGEAPTRDVIEPWLGRVRLLNAYGPAEASVCIATHVIESAASPSAIGRGCNARLWIVDPEDQDCLAGVGCVGELVVQGPGLARGYLNNEAATARAFIKAPAWLPRGAYERVYKTGDLVRYSDDGTIEYVGRKDTQIKIRGQRLESGEIEHHMRDLLHVARQVVVTKAQIAEQDVLVAFICTTNGQTQSLDCGLAEMDDGLVRAFVALSQDLATRVPAYMVPSYFIPVRAMPVTPTGKLNTRLLQDELLGMSVDELRQYAACQRAPFEEPRNETESRLRGLFSQVLNISESQISINDGFSQLGGDSLKVVTLQGQIRRCFDKMLSIQLLNRRAMSIRMLAPLVLGETTDAGAAEEDFGKVLTTMLDQIWPMGNKIRQDYVSVDFVPQAHVFLTGATGYLGTALLHRLVTESSIEKVTVLVRAKTRAQALERVKRSARLGGWWHEEFMAKLQVWKGDLGMRGFGLSQDEWRVLTSGVHAIVHNGAAVDWSADFASLKAVNVDSTRQLVEIALASPAHPRILATARQRCSLSFLLASVPPDYLRTKTSSQSSSQDA
ncbi:hypothetical protein CDD81_5223 [Ophiocordyceps australis]|uniref:Carrier domain-containing protein n=1 Tax=Ophiocordyceps australis TaxID=1399860 RepID=A0A2C5YIZ3_9HYPO|nr:hypothetical protein CDD81_5223 [Ophiocordyceps australis]